MRGISTTVPAVAAARAKPKRAAPAEGTAENSAGDPGISSDGSQWQRSPGAIRQARYRVKHRRVGLVDIMVVAPAAASADLQLQAEAMRAFKHLRPGPLRDPISGRLVSVKAVLREAARVIAAGAAAANAAASPAHGERSEAPLPDPSGVGKT
jgi:hypothetical protein